MEGKERYEWVDTLKFFGIFAIYLGHCIENAGKLYPFVFIYHVPLFFFVAGFFADNDKDKSISFYFKKKLRQLIIPYIIFSLISVISFSFALNLGGKEILEMIISYALGIRNTLISASLWFIPCIFIVSIMYFSIIKIFKSKVIVFIISIFLFVITQTILPNNPLEKASWFFNIDSAMYYILYYSLGAILFDFIKKINFYKISKKFKLLIVFSTIIALLIAAVTYLKGGFYIFERIKILKYIPLVANIYLVILALILIYLNILIAFLFKNIKFLKKIGANTIYMCGMENVMKLYLGTFVSIFSIHITLENPLSCIFYVLILLSINDILVGKYKVLYKGYFNTNKNIE